MDQVIELFVENKPGALMRVAGILSATGTNIDKLTVEPDAVRPGFSRMRITAAIEPRLRKRVVQQMNRLVNVITAAEVDEDRSDNIDCTCGNIISLPCSVF